MFFTYIQDNDLSCWAIPAHGEENLGVRTSFPQCHLQNVNREVADDITHIELSFLLETTNNVFYSILMYFEHIFFRYPSVNQDETIIIQFVRASKLNMLKFQISDSFYYCVII